MKTTGLIFSIFLFLIACTSSEVEKKPAAGFNKYLVIKKKFYEIKLPTDNKPQVYGFYSAGCLDGGVSLPVSGQGYQVLRISERRYYGHPALITFIKELAKQVHTENLGNILVGDMSMPRGGPMYYGHLSHQTGLDVDFAYTRITDREKRKLTIHDIDNMEDKSVMTEDLSSLDPEEWLDSHITVLKMAAEFDEVDRIFVNPFMLQEICNKIEDFKKEGEKEGEKENEKEERIKDRKKDGKEDKKDGEWIFKIKPWYGHHDHYHVRLKCPEKNPHCTPQKEETESVCGEELEKWFTEATMKKQKSYFKYQAKKKEEVPDLPEKCWAIVDYKDK